MDEFQKTRRDVDRRDGWGNCRKCPLTDSGHCPGHEAVIELNKVAHEALHSSIKKSDWLGGWKLGASIAFGLTAFIGFYAALHGISKSVLPLEAKQEIIIEEIRLLRNSSAELETRLTRIEAQIDQRSSGQGH